MHSIFLNVLPDYFARPLSVLGISTIDMLYGQFFKSQFFSFDDFMCGDVTEDTFVYAYNYLMKNI